MRNNGESSEDINNTIETVRAEPFEKTNLVDIETHKLVKTKSQTEVKKNF